MTDASLPEWLPSGWTVEFKSRKAGGRQTPYYVHSETGKKCFSKASVLQHAKKPGFQPKDPEPAPLKAEAPPENGETQIPEKAKERPNGLPDGWLVEVKTHKSGAREGLQYKVYVEPSTGFKCYSMPGVQRFIKDGRTKRAPKRGRSKRKRLSQADSSKPVIVERSEAKDLPPGWIKEVKRRSSGKLDPFYTDPVSGYVFKSRKDALRYIETGEVGHYASLPKNRVNELKPLLVADVKPETLEGHP